MEKQMTAGNHCLKSVRTWQPCPRWQVGKMAEIGEFVPIAAGPEMSAMLWEVVTGSPVGVRK